MMKLNNKGFAIASILYSIMVLFLILLFSILGMLGSRKAILDKNKKDIVEELNDAYTKNKIVFEHRNITVINNGNNDDILFALMDGVSAIDNNRNTISGEFISYDLDISNLENGTYNVTYRANNGGNTITGTRLVTFTNVLDVSTFSSVGMLPFTPTYNGAYKIELWGASGKESANTYADSVGRGAYTSGNIPLNNSQEYYVYVGGNEKYLNTMYTFNGGGTGNQNGGGATDFRLQNGDWNNFESLKSRIMVAAGGGGGASNTDINDILSRGDGGKLTGIDASFTYTDDVSTYSGSGATQTAGGLSGTVTNFEPMIQTYMSGSFGLGGYGTVQGNASSSGGGGGYYGGGHGTYPGSSSTGGGGGSSYISGYLGCNSISEGALSTNITHTGLAEHYSNYVFKNAVMFAGNEVMPTHDGLSTMTGNTGSGYAKISLIYYYE